jgi:formate-dependent nitrite reductase membrane component NrfD
MKKLFSLFALILVAFSGQAQEPEMADAMRADGKIYVVVIIIVVILIGLIGYLFMLDRNVKKLEEKIK